MPLRTEGLILACGKYIFVISLDTLMPYILIDHRVSGASIVPGAAFVHLLCQGAQSLLPQWDGGAVCASSGASLVSPLPVGSPGTAVEGALRRMLW
jgi:hypothetical protein